MLFHGVNFTVQTTSFQSLLITVTHPNLAIRSVLYSLASSYHFLTKLVTRFLNLEHQPIPLFLVCITSTKLSFGLWQYYWKYFQIKFKWIFWKVSWRPQAQMHFTILFLLTWVVCTLCNHSVHSVLIRLAGTRDWTAILYSHLCLNLVLHCISCNPACAHKQIL
jgi:hypothetical protein